MVGVFMGDSGSGRRASGGGGEVGKWLVLIGGWWGIVGDELL